ncbi:MAG: hypothetical protein GXY36_19440 [Chloroflexi bacterium]|jgi:hypothetical protein|nr:hypothetical protein [Chloroflexota bacterium]
MFTFKRWFVVFVLVMVALLVGNFALATETRAQDTQISALEFHNAMRKLWEDHITWTRLYIVSTAADLPDTDAVAGRLLQNQVDIGNAIRPFYGDEAADQLTALLQEHITGAVAVLDAAKAGDQAQVESATEAWYVNGDEIAVFLSTANPDNWTEPHMKAEMKMHLDLTLQEAVDHLGGNSAASIAGYDEVHEHILHMADMLSSGIMAQFPDQFSAATLPA